MIRLEWWKKGAQSQLRSHDGTITWATIDRVAPYYRIRLFHGPCSQIKKSGSLRAAKEISEQWAEQRTA